MQRDPGDECDCGCLDEADRQERAKQARDAMLLGTGYLVREAWAAEYLPAERVLRPAVQPEEQASKRASEEMMNEKMDRCTCCSTPVALEIAVVLEGNCEGDLLHRECVDEYMRRRAKLCRDAAAAYAESAVDAAIQGDTRTTEHFTRRSRELIEASIGYEDERRRNP